MSLPPQKFRELVFQLLYSYDMGYSEEKEIAKLLMKELAVARKHVFLAQERVVKVQSHRDLIDEMIGKTTISYEFDRIQSVERNILRLGVFEVLYDPSIPPVVAISEAVRMAKKFGSPESASFVNAILDSIYKLSLGEVVDKENLKRQADLLREKEQVIADLEIDPPSEE